jgi:hypothetical protein
MFQLLEHHHKERFKEYMDRFLPQWRVYREEMSPAPLPTEPGVTDRPIVGARSKVALNSVAHVDERRNAQGLSANLCQNRLELLQFYYSEWFQLETSPSRHPLHR